jgi:hypothetical protein
VLFRFVRPGIQRPLCSPSNLHTFAVALSKDPGAGILVFDTLMGVGDALHAVLSLQTSSETDSTSGTRGETDFGHFCHEGYPEQKIEWLLPDSLVAHTVVRARPTADKW